MAVKSLPEKVNITQKPQEIFWKVGKLIQLTIEQPSNRWFKRI